MKGLVLLLAAAAGATVYDYSAYVNPFIGGAGPTPGSSYGGGDIFVGASMPFGVAKVGIDTFDRNQSFAANNGGWTPQGLVTGISMMHESGTGGPPKYGIVSQMPLTSVAGAVNLLDNTTYWQNRTTESASVGYYSASLSSGVRLQLSASRHAGVFEYDFPAGSSPHILVDVSHFLSNEVGSSLDQYYAGGSINTSSTGAQYTGHGTFGGGFSNSAPMTTFFCADFDTTPSQSRTFRGRNTFPGQRQHVLSNEPVPWPTYRGRLQEDSGPLGDRVGAVFTWNTTRRIRSRVGISMVSVDQACAWKSKEIPTWTLNDTVVATVAEWNRDVFGKIQVPTGPQTNHTNLVLLYSSLYFMHLMPSDRSGENPLWDSPDSWDDFYTLWDIFRCTVSLYHLIQPTYYASMVRSLIDIWKFEGYMPDGRSGNYNGLTQGGSNADNVLADAYVKGLAGVNWTEGYQAMLKDAEVTPFNTFVDLDETGSVQQGRGALDDWLRLGYVASDNNNRAISRTIEYSLNDFAVAQVAKGVAPGDSGKYLKRSANWQNIWNNNVIHKGFRGFPAPRLASGEYDLDGYNPAQCGGCSWRSVTYEATPFEYAFTVPHDMQTLISYMGGAEAFERRLDYIFQPNTSEANLGPNGQGIDTIMNIGNEPDFATPFEYHYLNKQAKSVTQSRAVANKYFHNAQYGVPGNSDAGALNSWLVWQMLGIYPVVTQPVYLLVSPWFDDVNMTVNHNKTLRIRASGLDNSRRFHVQSVRINGQAWTKNWFEHGDVMEQGGTIEFELGSDMASWETGSVPPSPGRMAS